MQYSGRREMIFCITIKFCLKSVSTIRLTPLPLLESLLYIIFVQMKKSTAENKDYLRDNTRLAWGYAGFYNKE